MRKLAADFVFPVSYPPLRNGVLILDDNGTIAEVTDTKGELHDSAEIEFYNGILVPGFVNAHCHLELSHLKGVIPRQTGLTEFVSAIQKYRSADIKRSL